MARDGATLEEAIEQIDIGGVALIRAAAKNFEHVSVLIDPDQYAALRENGGKTDLAMRRRFATRAFERTAEYDSSIARYLEAGLLASELPGSLALTIPLASPLRYGENPQSRAAFYLSRTDQLPEQLGGKALSYNNLLDLDATLRLLVREVPEAQTGVVRAAIVKHTVPCGVAERPTALAAAAATLAADPVSAYGGIIALDGAIDLATANALAEFFLEIVAAPGIRRGRARAVAAEKEPAHHPVRSATSRTSGPRVARPKRARRCPRRRRRSGCRAGNVARRVRPAADARRVARHVVRVGRGPSREIERHRGRARRDHARHLRRPNESCERGAHRVRTCGRVRARCRVRERRLLPVCGRSRKRRSNRDAPP